jgi:hypothetical protein
MRRLESPTDTTYRGIERAKGKPVTTAPRMGRLGMLAVGLGIGAAVTALPGTASADPIPVPFDPNVLANSVDGLGIGAAMAAVPAPASPTDIDISIDGMDVFNGGGSAHATSGMGDMAIAIGPNSDAFAQGGFGDFASAFSTGGIGAQAVAGTDSLTDTGNNFDFASAYGSDSIANAGGVAGTTGSSFDYATAFGTVSVADAGFNGSGDYASAIGDNVESLAGGSPNAAITANADWASIWGNLFTPTSSTILASAGGGPDVFNELGGSNDLAFVLDPFGTVGSEALAGLGHNFDLAGVLGDDLSATSTLADFLAHIAPLF